MRKVQFSQLLIPILFAIAPVYGATPLDFIGQTRFSGSLKSTSQQVSFAAIDGNAVIYQISPRLRNGRTGSAIYATQADAAKQLFAGDRVLAGPSAADGNRLLLAELTPNGPRLRVFDARNGSKTELNVSPPYYGAAVGYGKCAVLTGTRGESVVSVFDVATGTKLGEWRDRIDPMGRRLSFRNGSTLLLFSMSEPYLWELSLTEPVYNARGIRLQGDAVRVAMENAASSGTSGFRSALPSGRVAVAAHTTTASGNDLFFLAPFRISAGLRLVEFDLNGIAVQDYVLRIPDAHRPSSGLSVRPELLTVTAEEIAIAGQDGLLYRFRRPQ